MDIVKRLREGRTDGTALRWQVGDIHRESATIIEALRRDLAEARASEAKWKEDALGEHTLSEALNGMNRRLKDEFAEARAKALDEAIRAAEECSLALPLAVGTADGASTASKQIVAALRALKQGER